MSSYMDMDDGGGVTVRGNAHRPHLPAGQPDEEFHGEEVKMDVHIGHSSSVYNNRYIEHRVYDDDDDDDEEEDLEDDLCRSSWDGSFNTHNCRNVKRKVEDQERPRLSRQLIIRRCISLLIRQDHYSVEEDFKCSKNENEKLLRRAQSENVNIDNKANRMMDLEEVKTCMDLGLQLPDHFTLHIPPAINGDGPSETKAKLRLWAQAVAAFVASASTLNI